MFNIKKSKLFRTGVVAVALMTGAASVGTSVASAATVAHVQTARAQTQVQKKVDNLTIKNLTSNATINSHGKAVTIYKNAGTTEKAGLLNKHVTIWKAYREAVNSAGQVVSVEIGTNQWVKISDGVTLTR